MGSNWDTAAGEPLESGRRRAAEARSRAVMSLAEFLLLQIGHDEGTVPPHDYWCSLMQVGGGACDCPRERRLAECRAKRQIVGYRQQYDHPETEADRALFPTLAVPLDRVLRIMASVYADRPGYRQEWRL